MFMAEKQRIRAMVEGGKAVPGPPLGPALAMAKVNIAKVIAEINDKTKGFAGIQVPVTIAIDLETKEFEIEVGKPPVSQLIKKELKLETLAKTPWTTPVPKEGESPPVPFTANLKLEQIVKIAKAKFGEVSGTELKKRVKEVVGTCTSCGVMVEQMKPKDALREIEKGSWDDRIK